MGNILIVSYAIYSVIVFLNLLIATMNSTIQKVSDKRHLYWKFVRTGIWVDFFGEESALPPPFNLITGFVIFVTFVVKKIVKQCCPPSQVSSLMQVFRLMQQ
jgi:transient receptor potential cation channel subfamily M protein 2